MSITVLLMFPMAIAGYYWSNAASESPEPPQYLQMDEADKPALVNEPLGVEPAPLVSVTPDTPMTLDAPQTVSFPAAPEGATLSVPQPLNVSPGSAAPLSQTEHTVPVPFPVPVGHPKVTVSPGNCVWLTGTIEELDSSPEVWQNASRVHDLTSPIRN
ncbi:MAG: hypothetical protein KDA84_05735 [Planctomycetaceae bacterium]|nr:hypothetical protein [Planctomycetaceae bacterium]